MFPRLQQICCYSRECRGFLCCSLSPLSACISFLVSFQSHRCCRVSPTPLRAISCDAVWAGMSLPIIGVSLPNAGVSQPITNVSLPVHHWGVSAHRCPLCMEKAKREGEQCWSLGLTLNVPISSVSSFRKQKAGLGCGRGRGEVCGWGRREKCLLSAHPRTIWPPSQWRNLLILPSPGWHTPYSMVLPCRGCSSTLTACCYFISRVKMANPGGGWWGMAQCHVCAHPLLAQPSLGVLHTHTPKVFLFFFLRGKGELLMSLEPLPWEPVANESLGFPLHLEPCVSW